MIAAVGLGGCSGTARDIAQDDAARKAATIAKEIRGQRGVNWSSEDYGRRAAPRDDMILLDVSGKDAVSGVTLTIKVSGTGAEPGWFGSGQEQQFDFCFTVTISMAGAGGPKPADCPNRTPLTYPPRPPAAQLPPIETLAEVLSGVTDESGVQAALAQLDLDQRISVDLVVKDAIVGVALKAYNNDRQMDCRLARVAPGTAGPQVWLPASVYLQPGEMSCSAVEAVGGSGQRPPH